MIGIDTTICIEEIVDRTENLFLARLLGRGPPPSNAFLIWEVSTPRTTSGAYPVCLYRSPDTFRVPLVQFHTTFALVHN